MPGRPVRHLCGVAWTHVAPEHRALHLDPEKAQGVGRMFRKVPDEGRLGSGQRHHHTGTARQATLHCATASESSQGLHGTEFHYNSVLWLKAPSAFRDLYVCTWFVRALRVRFLECCYQEPGLRIHIYSSERRESKRERERAHGCIKKEASPWYSTCGSMKLGAFYPAICLFGAKSIQTGGSLRGSVSQPVEGRGTVFGELPEFYSVLWGCDYLSLCPVLAGPDRSCAPARP